MALAPDGTLFVGTREGGYVYAVVDRNGDRRADAAMKIADSGCEDLRIYWVI